jgi:hypothetical protein
MRVLVQQFFAIARLTAIEAIRQPVVLLVAIACVALTALLPLLVTHTLGEGERLARDSGLALHFVSGLVLGCLAASASIAREIRRGTAASVLSKPVGRAVFLLSKFAGIAVVMTGFSIAAAIATLMAARVAAPRFGWDWSAGTPLLLAPVLACALAGLLNFLAGRPFASNASGLLLLMLVLALAVGAVIGPQPLARAYDYRILQASALIAIAILVLAAAAVSLSVRLDTIPVLAICSVLFFAGLVSDYLFGRHAERSALALLAHRILPNWQHFWMADALTDGRIPWSYVGDAAAYGGLYLAGILCLGILVFGRVEVKS